MSDLFPQQQTTHIPAELSTAGTRTGLRMLPIFEYNQQHRMAIGGAAINTSTV